MAAPLVHQVNIKATPEQIYDAVSTAKGLGAFWTSESQAESRVGAIATFGFGGPSQRMRIDELKPGKRVKWTALADFPNWDGTTVTWDISPAENGETGVLSVTRTGRPRCRRATSARSTTRGASSSSVSSSTPRAARRTRCSRSRLAKDFFPLPLRWRAGWGRRAGQRRG